MSREPISLKPQGTKNGGVRYPKMYRGNRFPCPVYPEDSRRNRSDAWQKFLAWRAGIDQTDQDTRLPEHQALHDGVDILERSAEYLSLVKREEQARLIRDIAKSFRQEIGETPNHVIAAELHEVLQAQTDLAHKLATVDRVIKQKDSEVIAKTVAEKYLRFQATRARSKQITAGTFGRIRSNVNTFVAWFGESKELTTITTDTVAEYHTHLLKRIANGESSSTMWGHQQGFQQFLEWAGGHNDDIPVPKNLRAFTITKSRTEPDPYTVDEFRLIYDNAPERTKLYLCLMLNFAGYQSDVGDMTADEVDWQKGRVIRARSKKQKTQQQGDIIKINYLLWDETFRLLKKFGHREGIVVRNKKGNPVVVSGLRPDEDVEYRNDNVKSAFSRVKEKMKKNGLTPPSKGLKQLRKTGSNFIADNEDFAEFYGMILDHTSVRNYHYLKSGRPHAKFDKAMIWLGKQFGFPTKRKR